MDRKVYFVAINDNDTFAVIVDGRPASVRLPKSEVYRFKENNALVKIEGGECSTELNGRSIAFSNFKFEKTGQNGVGHYSADSWNWLDQ